jgi:hypothetical protein
MTAPPPPFPWNRMAMNTFGPLMKWLSPAVVLFGVIELLFPR